MKKNKKRTGQPKTNKKRPQGKKDNFAIASVWRNRTVGVGLLVVMTALCFSHIFNCDFVNFDDPRIILNNQFVTDGTLSIKDILTAWMYSAHFKPITFLTWNMEYRIAGANPFIFHFNNLLLHILNTVLVFYIILLGSKYFKCTEPNRSVIAFFVALIFAIHPMHVESVAWATERKDVLYSFFFLGGILSYLKYVKTSSVKWLVLATICYPLSMFSKSTGITLIVLLPLMDYMAGRNLFSKKNVVEKIPFLLFLILGLYCFGLLDNFYGQASGLTTHVTEYEHIRFEEKPGNLTGLGGIYETWLLLNFKLIAWTLHIIFPFKLSVVYPRTNFIEAVGWGIHVLPFINLIVAGLLLFFRRKFNFIFICILFYLITILPALSVPDNGNGTFLSDRYTYIPSIGVIVLIIGGFVYLIKKEALKYGLLLGISALLGVACFLQTKAWKNSIALWSHSIKHYPELSIPYSNRGLAYCQLGKLDEGMVDLKKAVSISDGDYSSHHNIGNILAQRKQFQEALAEFSTAIKYKNTKPEIFKARGDTYFFLGKTQLALQDYSQAIQLDADDPTLYLNRAKAHFNLGDRNSALKDVAKVRELGGVVDQAFLNLIQ
ncbi:MAG: tetratricopeptide repeat protein [Bacteroidota bacterium]